MSRKKNIKFLWVVLGSYNPILLKILIAIILYGILCFFMSKMFPYFTNYRSIFTHIYWGIVVVEIIRERRFGIKWYIKDSPKSMCCPNCQ